MKRLQDRIAVIPARAAALAGDCPADGVSGSQNCGERFGSQHRWHRLRHDCDEVVEEIKALAEAVSNTDSVADVAGGERLIQTAIDAFGGMDILSTMPAFCAIAPFSKWKNPIGMQCSPCT